MPLPRLPEITRVSPERAQRARRWRRRLGAVGEGSFYALEKVGVSPIALFDRLSKLREPKGARKIADGVAYGDHRRQRLDIFRPVRRGSAPLPVVVFFYGGGWVKGERAEFGFVGRALARAGFVAVLPDYRLAPEGRFPTFVEDGAAALAWVTQHIEELGGDPERVAIAGHSAGGHLAALLALDPRYLEAHGLPRDTIKAAGLISAPTNFLPLTDPRALAALGHHEAAHEHQPITHVRGDAPPMLLQHGTADIVVRARNSQQLGRKLFDRGADVRLLLYRGARHSDPIKAFSPLFAGLPVPEDLIAFLHRRLAN